MGGKKTVEKSREWEKERRDKLNTGFNDLYKLLPDHDPSISLSKMDILRKAAEYIRLLQDQNEDIIKSGDNDVLRNEAERLKKRVAYLLLKTKELVTALRAAGVPIPNNSKKKKKSKAQKVVNGKDQNHSPLPSGANTVQQVPCAILVGSGGKPTVSIVPATPLPEKKAKCGCEKAAKKNPLSELNCTSAATTSGHPVPRHVTVVPGISQPGPTILGGPVQANIQTLAPTLGPGTLIFRDGRVVNVPPPAPIVPQILVKPQPTLIFMQRTPTVPLKRDKVPLIAPKRREITQTTFANKAPIPAIKTFCLESYPRPYKPKGKKKKDAKSDGRSPTQTAKIKIPISQKAENSLSVDKNSSESTAVNPKSPGANKLKRKAEPIICKTKAVKPSSIHFLKAKEKPEASEESKKSENDQTFIQVDNPHKIVEEKSLFIPVHRIDENMEVVTSNYGSINKDSTIRIGTQASGTHTSTQAPSSDIASSHVATSVVELRFSLAQKTTSVHETVADDKHSPLTDPIEVNLDTVEKVQRNVESEVNPVRPDGVHEKPLDEDNVSIPEALSHIEKLDPNGEKGSSGPTKMVVDSNSVENLNNIQSPEKSSVLINDSGEDDHSSQILDVSDKKESPVVEKMVLEKDLHKDSEATGTMLSNLNDVQPVKGLKSPEKPQHQKIPGNEKDETPFMDRSPSLEDPRKFPLFSNTDLQERDILERANFSVEGLEQYRSAHQSCSVSTSGKSLLNTQKTSAGSLLAGTATVSSSLSSSLAKPSGTLCSNTTTPGSIPNHAVTCISLPDVDAMPSSGFPCHAAVQGASLSNHLAISASLLPNHSVVPAVSTSSISATTSCPLSCPSAMPVSSLCGNSASLVDALPTTSFTSHTAVPMCSMSSNTAVHTGCTPTSEATIRASHNYPTSLSLHSAPSKAGSQPVFQKSQVDFSVLGPSTQFSFERNHHNQRTASSVSKPGTKSSVSSIETNQMTALKDQSQRNTELDADQCTVVHNLNSVSKSSDYRHEPFGLQNSTNLKDIQCSKPATSLGNESIAQEVGASQKLPYSEHFSRTNISNQLAPVTATSIQSNVSTALSNTSMSTSLATSSQVYSFGISVVPTEPSRPESFFNYENPIATLPSDPFFSNFKPTEMPGSCAANTGFGYSTFTTQAPPVRSVARQLFPADPLCSISSSYNLDTNLPPLNSSTAGQMFQFSSYSNTNSLRDPLLFTNDFLSTPTKNTAVLESAPHDKDPSLNSTHTFPDMLHPTTSMNPLSNIPCSFSVGQMPPTSSNYVSSEFRTSTDHSNCKQYPAADQSMFNIKRIPKSGSDANFSSMNVITSSSELRIQDTRQSSNTDYSKTVETAQNFNFPYLNTPQSLAPQMSLDSYNFNMRDPVKQSQNIPSRSLILQNHTNSSNHSLAGKNFQKTSNHGLNPQKPSLPKGFSISTSGASSSSARGLCDLQPNVFHNNANSVYQDTSAKSTQGTSNFRICGSNSQSSNQGVQTHQSYPCNPNSQAVLNKVPPPGSQIFTCSSQANQIHSTHYDKKYPKSGQDSLYAVSDNHMKITGGQTSTDTADCSVTVRTHKNYQPVTSLSHSSLKTSSHNANFSTNAMFSHTNTNRPMQGPIIGSYPGASGSTVPQSIYSHPTTAASNQGYSRIGDGSRNMHQNLFRVSHMSTSTSTQSNPPPYQSNLCSSSSQIFSTVESLAQQNVDASHNHKPQNNAGNQMVSHAQLDQSDVNVFGGMGAPQNHPNQKDSQADMMSAFRMISITGYPSQSLVPSDSNSMAKNDQNQNQTYSRVPSTKQISNVNKSTRQYPPNSSHNPAPSAKQFDYPFPSMLAGLNDTVLNRSALAASETSQSSKGVANTASSEKTSCNDKQINSIDKQYSTNTEGNSFKTTENSSCNADYLRNKDNERNFIPIMEDVRLNSEFSNDLFSSLQVPTGGAHADSISPTAAFLLAFPLVSTSKNSENPHESDPQDNNTSTPTTILQIGNIEPSNSEMFHPLEFGKDLEASEYLGHLPDKCKRKENVNPKQKKPNNAYNSYSYPSMSGDYSVHYDQSWSDQSRNKGGESRKKNDKPSKFCGNSNNYELCKDKKKKSKISVNWMASPDVETFQKDQEASSFQANLSFPMDIDALPDLCSSKKANAYSWSPSKSLLPLDSGLVIPSTLPTLVGDLALGTPTPADTYKRCDNSKKQDKSPEKQNSQKSQSNFLSVSQLVDPKSKKKLPDKCKKTDKKKSASFQKRKDPASSVPSEPCMYPDGFLPPLGWDKYRYRNNYSAEALIASQDVNDSGNFTYQQNPNYFMGSDLNQEHHHQSQQFQNSINFSQNQFPSFAAEEYQNASFSINNTQSSASKRGGSVDKRFREDASQFSGGAAATYQHHPPSLQPYPSAPLPPSSAPHSSHPSNFTSNTTTSVTNFNLSTIFPEINERTGSQGQTGPSQQQPQQQQQQQQHGAQSHPHNSMSSFQNSNPTNNYRTHSL